MQSAAALVAIVGGLVVSRLLSLASERGAADRQIRLLEGRIRGAQHEVENLRAELVAQDAASAVPDWIDHLLIHPEASDDDLVQACKPGPWLHREYEPHLHALRREVDSVTSVLQRYAEEVRNSGIIEPDLPSSCEGLRDLGYEVPDEFENQQIWNQVVLNWRSGELSRMREARRNSRSSFMRPIDVSIPELSLEDPVRRTVALERRDSDERRLQDQEAKIFALNTELEIIRNSRTESVDSARLWQGFAILAFNSLTGVVYPMLLLAVADTNVQVQHRIPVVALFSIGIMLLLTFVAGFVREVNRA